MHALWKKTLIVKQYKKVPPAGPTVLHLAFIVMFWRLFHFTSG